MVSWSRAVPIEQCEIVRLTRILASGLLARVLSVLSRSTALQFRGVGLTSEVIDENEKVWQLR
jgi:hypothetical protein